MTISQKERWEQNFAAVKQFIEKKKCLPSKHRVEDHRLLNWIKYNRKLIAQDRLLPERRKKFEQLMTAAASYHKINQYTYISGEPVYRKGRGRKDKSLSLF